MSTDAAVSVAPEVAGELARIIDGRAVRAVFQPLIDLASGDVVGFEALARGPAGSMLESPGALFEAAYGIGRVAELDWVCRAAASGARAELDPALRLFVNCETASLGVACPDDLWPAVDVAERRLRVVMEVTERAVARDPAGLLGAVARARAVGWGVALDDVGAEPASLAVMPFVRPDVIKLDLRLVQGRTTAEVARIVNAVRAQAELTGARILAEGIETRRHAEIARPGRDHRPGLPVRRPGGCRPGAAHPTAVELLQEPPAQHPAVRDRRRRAGHGGPPGPAAADEPAHRHKAPTPPSRVLPACFRRQPFPPRRPGSSFRRLSAGRADRRPRGRDATDAGARGPRGRAPPRGPAAGRVGRDHGRAPLRRRPGGQGLRRRRPGRRPEVRLRHHPRPGAGRPGRPPLLDKLAPAS
jgi:EAL domain-containing protein (putative c-di-GMP-specific phosphodiesterase class I)